MDGLVRTQALPTAVRPTPSFATSRTGTHGRLANSEYWDRYERLAGTQAMQFGHDLARVRIHSRSTSDEPARTNGALARRLRRDSRQAQGAGLEVRLSGTVGKTCACGGITGRRGECEACRARRLALGTVLFDGDRPARVTSKPSESLRLIPTDVAAALRKTCDSHCGKLLGGPFGETECDIDLTTNMPTGTVLVTVTDTDPCTRPCVEVHEAVHEQHMRPVCRDLHACLKRSPAEAAQERCWKLSIQRIASMAPAMECAAYRVEADCFRRRREDKACASDESRKRLERRARGVDCYRDCFCGGVAAAARRASSR
jgi:hypothetical protein